LLLAVLLICIDPGYDSSYLFELISTPAHSVDFIPVAVSYSIMSDIVLVAISYYIMGYTDSDADSISDASNAHSDDDDHDDGDQITVRKLCDRLRANDPRVLNYDSVFELISSMRNFSEAECIAVFQALKENTSVNHIDFSMLFDQDNYTERCAAVAAEYVESSKTLRTLDLSYGRHQYSHEGYQMISLVLRALSRNTSVTKLIINTETIRFASVAFQELLTCTQTLQELEMIWSMSEAFDEVQAAAVASGFASNTTLRDIEFNSWQETDLATVLTALQDHPALEEIHLSASEKYGDYLLSLSGVEALLRSQNSKVKELVIEQVASRTVGLHPVLQELGRNTTVTNLTIRESVFSRENFQKVKAMLRQNTALQSLNLTSSYPGSAGLAEIAPALYRNTSIKSLDLSKSGLDDIESANVLRELIRRNNTITSLCLVGNRFGRNAAAARSIFEGLRSNTAVQQLDLSACVLNDQSLSILANALVTRNTGILELDLGGNEITSVGVRALIDDNVEAVKTLTKLCLSGNPVRSEGASILANALRRNTMPNLKQLRLIWCGIDDDGFVALVSALEQNTSLQIIELKCNDFAERGFSALAESLPNIKGLQEIVFMANASFHSTLPLLLEGFRKNSSLVKVKVTTDIYGAEQRRGEWSQELKFLGQRNRFTPLLKASDPLDASPQLGIWSRALAKVATEPDVLFHVLRNKPKLVGSAGGSKKRKRDDE
jgi:Ran GTPase-activating protein (RanGAP) involved in mRNA processing and transport